MTAPVVPGFSIVPTGGDGIHTSRPRYRVECLRCRAVVHQNTTGPEAWAAGHDRHVEHVNLADAPPVLVVPSAAPALAVIGDHCSRCRRTINVNEPIHGTVGGGIWCNACNDAASAARPLPPAPDLVTSVLMRRAAVLLDRYNGGHSDEVRIIAHELRLRAALLQGQALVGHPGAAGRIVTALMRAIGEVR